MRSTQMKSIIEYKKSYPSLINKKFKTRKVDSAFISSIASRNEKQLNLGIVAKKEVLSVLLIPGIDEKDFQSETSNALAKVLGLSGKVLIGDKALKFYHSNKNKDENENKDFIDLAQCWNNKYNLPFVFAVLSYCSNKSTLEKLIKNFNKNHIKIPRYILNQYSQRTGISNKNILSYLKKIDYNIGIKEKRSLKLFLKLSKEKGL
jgi:chorismate dehydratase